MTDRAEQNDEEQANFRQEFVSLYQEPVMIDTLVIDSNGRYKIIFRHFSTLDNGIVVPARYNFDTNQDFTTHNFASDLSVLSDNDTVFKQHITKTIFNSILDTPDTSLKKYATLLYPTIKLHNDSIQIHYSISIPVTDIGIGASIVFNKPGNYIIEQ